MANIKSGVLGNVGWQGTDEACGPVSVYNLRQYINTVFTVDPSGTRTVDQNATQASGDFAAISQFECGNSYIFYRQEGTKNTTFNLPDYVLGNPPASSGAVTTRYPTEFSIEGKGTFHITSGYKDPGVSGLAWFNTHPVYKTKTNENKIWYDGNSYVLSTKVGDRTGGLDNESVLPNISFGDHATSSHTIEISGFTGTSAAANGLYAEVGYLHGQPMYRHGKYGYYYFFDGTHWILSNRAYNASGSSCYIKGSTDKFGPLNNASGGNGRCFDGQTGNARDGEVDPRSLATESDVDMKLLATEAVDAKVLITEAD